MAQSNEIEHGVSSTSLEKCASPKHSSKKKKSRLAPPEINRLLQMKWGLALLGEERSREYLAWLYEKLNRKAQQ